MPEVSHVLTDDHSNPNVMLGKPVIEGTHITVELLLEKLAAGESSEQIQRAYPHLPPETIPAVLAYVLAAVRNEVVVSMERRSS